MDINAVSMSKKMSVGDSETWAETKSSGGLETKAESQAYTSSLQV